MGSGRSEGRADWFRKNSVFSDEHHISWYRPGALGPKLVRPIIEYNYGRDPRAKKRAGM